jgi:hypothetical protein
LIKIFKNLQLKENDLPDLAIEFLSTGAKIGIKSSNAREES